MKIDFYWASIIALIVLSICLFAPLQIQTDTPSFTNAIDLLLGHQDAESDRLMRLSKPLSLYLPALLVSLGINASWAMIIQQYLAIIVSLYFINYLYTKVYCFDKASTYRTMLLYLSSSVVFVYAYAALNDMPAWAFTWALMAFSHKIQNAKLPFPKYILWGILAALGIFIKESVLVAGVYIFWLILLDKNKDFSEKIKIYIAIGLPFLLVLSAGLWLTKSLFNYNLLDWFAFNHDDEAALYEGQWLKVYLIHFVRIFDVFWLFLPLGIFLGKGVWHWKKIYMLGAIILFLIYPIVWAYMLERIMFMFAPFYLYLLALGLKSIGDKSAISANLFLFFGILANLIASYGAYIALWQGVLYWVYGLYFCLFLCIKIGTTYAVAPKYKA